MVRRASRGVSSGSSMDSGEQRASRSESSGSLDSGAAVAFRAGKNSLERTADGSMRPGRLLEPGAGVRAAIIDASQSVEHASNTPCRGLETWAPRWQGSVHAIEKYRKSLNQRHWEGSLRGMSALGRKQQIDDARFYKNILENVRRQPSYA